MIIVATLLRLIMTPAESHHMGSMCYVLARNVDGTSAAVRCVFRSPFRWLCKSSEVQSLFTEFVIWEFLRPSWSLSEVARWRVGCGVGLYESLVVSVLDRTIALTA